MPAPFLIDTHDLGRSPGSMTQLERTVTVLEPLGTDVIAVRAGAQVDLDLRLEAVSDGVLVTGTVSGTADGECVRCLRALTQPVLADVTELYVYPGRREELRGEEEDPLPALEGDQVDIEGVVTDALVPALPFQPVCEPTCAGLCSVCGVRLDDAEPGHAHSDLDPRWAALAALAGPVEDEDEDGDGEQARS